METIAIIYSDAHNHSFKQFNEFEKRTKNNTKVQRKIYRKARKLKVPVFFAGDLFHNPKSLSNQLLSIFLPEFFKWHKKTKTYAITGNHDQCYQNTLQLKSPSYIETLSNIIDNFHCIDYKTVDLGDYVLHGIPYLTMNIGFRETMDSFKIIKGKKNILMVHTDLHGAKDTNMREIKTVSQIPTDMSDYFAKFDLVISGHIHLAQEIIPNHILMLGAPNQQRKTDKGTDMGYWELYSDLTYKFIPLMGPEFIELEPGETAPDDYNMYYSTPKPKIIKTEDNHKNIDSKDISKLVKSYAKAESINNKDKVKRLIKTLRDNQ